MWAEGGDCLVGFVREVWVFLYIWQESPCFGMCLPLGLVHSVFFGGRIVGSRGDWGEVESCLIWLDG